MNGLIVIEEHRNDDTRINLNFTKEDDEQESGFLATVIWPSVVLKVSMYNANNNDNVNLKQNCSYIFEILMKLKFTLPASVEENEFR